MIILGMDTSSVNACVAVMNDEKILGEYTVSHDRTHSQIIMPMLDDMLKNCGLTIEDADVFAAATGPGSFTGLRIGISTIKTFAQVLGKPVVGISSLESLAANVTFDGLICPIADARRDSVYNALYRGGECVTEPRVTPVDELVEELKGQKVMFLGDGMLKYSERILGASADTFCGAPTHLNMQNAASLCACAYKRAVKGDFDNLYSLEPLYLRKSQAEQELEKGSLSHEA